MSLNDDPIHDWAYQPIPERLWHYTSIQGFQGIITSRRIYATDVRFLNDTEEFIHARKVANELIKETPEFFGDVQFPLREHLEKAVASIFGTDFLDPNCAQIFVVSFTECEDDLSQWRGYSHGTCGASVSFDLRAFRPPIESDSAVTFAPCVYEDAEKQKLIQSALQHFLKVTQMAWNDAMAEFLKNFIPGKTKPSFAQIKSFTDAKFDDPQFKAQLKTGLFEARKRIHRLSGLLKHRAFHHEREWRLVLPISPGKNKANLIHPISFRSTKMTLIPYIEFPLEITSMLGESEISPTKVLPVNDVLLGPGASSDTVSAAFELLKSNSIKIVPRLTDVPYRQV